MPFPPLPRDLEVALESKGYAEPTPVQAAVLGAPVESDLLVSAQTGSGKTVAFGLAMAVRVLAPRTGTRVAPLGLVVAPTRELALQVARELEWLYAHAGARVVTCVGGMDARREQRLLARGCDVVVGTPGRLCDHVRRGNLDASALSAIVLDEADEMLDLGFREELECVLDAAPKERRTLLFSATIPKEIEALAARYQREAVRIATSSADEPHGDIEYFALKVQPGDREHAVVNVLRWFDVRGALVFCATRETVKHLHSSLLERGFAVVALSGELGQAERTRAVQALRDGRARACVATDVAARGLDLPDLGLVIHGDLPRDASTLTHRSGRTGRAGRKGTAVLLVTPREARHAERILHAARVDATWAVPPSADAIRERDEERLLETIAEASASPAAEDVAVAARLLGERTPEQLAAALVRMHRSLLPAAEELDAVPERDERPGPGPARRGPPRRHGAGAPPHGPQHRHPRGRRG